MNREEAREEAIAVLENEIKCVDKDCNIERSCGSCPYAMPSKEPILEAYRLAIETLEQEPCDDAISRKDLGLTDFEIVMCDGNYKEALIMLLDKIKEAPSVQPKQMWIPVSERLPEVGSEVLVCFDFKGKRSVYIADFYGDGEFHGLDDEYLTSEGRKYRKAVAWMPLPDPYKASPTSCSTCILDNTDACSRGAGRAVDDEACEDYIASPTGAEGSDKE